MVNMMELEEAATATNPTRDDRGASLVEYALLVALIAVACMVAVVFLGNEASDNFSRTGSSVFQAGK
jgi:pilus assembly protein Flp/PilA